LILLTSNAGSDVLMQACKDPNKPPDVETLTKALRKPLLDVFPPALLGRMVTIPYYPLSDAMIRSIVQLQLGRIVQRVQTNHGVPLSYDDSVAALIASRCTELESGARMIEALLSNTVLPRLSHEFLTRLVSGTPIKAIELTTRDGDFAYNLS
jgi:type VI secretion system protein VasG